MLFNIDLFNIWFDERVKFCSYQITNDPFKIIKAVLKINDDDDVETSIFDLVTEDYDDEIDLYDRFFG